jgi:hypothetical protein
VIKLENYYKNLNSENEELLHSDNQYNSVYVYDDPIITILFEAVSGVMSMYRVLEIVKIF